MMSKPLNPAHVEWSRQHFRTIAEGCTWGVPRSGLIFTKRGGRLELTARMPHHPAMPVTPLKLKRQQRHEFLNVKRHFEAAGIPVVDLTGGNP
jgi:hypothetical protein